MLRWSVPCDSGACSIKETAHDVICLKDAAEPLLNAVGSSKSFDGRPVPTIAHKFTTLRMQGLTASELHHDNICGRVVIRQPVRRVLEVNYASYFAHALLGKLVCALDFAFDRYACRAKKGLVSTHQPSTRRAAAS